MTERVYRAFFPFCGAAGGALGFLLARVQMFGLDARFECAGGIDADPLACEDFRALTGTAALCADIDQVSADEELLAPRLTVAMLRAYAGDERPDVVFLSPPCKGHTALISQTKRAEPRYQRMNELGLDWVRLMLEAWDEPPPLVLFENVPRVTTHGRDFLAAAKNLLSHAGYTFHGGYHDCGELGGLAQVRQRFLLVARHAASAPPLLYRPPKLRVRGCGEVLGALPVPNAPLTAGRMHVMPRIGWRNWIRLALIPAGGDHRDLPGVLGLEEPRRAQFRRYQLTRWDEPTPTIGGSGSNGAYGVQDPRVRDAYDHGYAVLRWEQPSFTVAGGSHPGQGAYSVADPRITTKDSGFETLGVTPWESPARTVTGTARPSNGRFSVADPRIGASAAADVLKGTPRSTFANNYRVRGWEQPAATVIGASRPGSGAQSVADPRTFSVDDVRCPEQRAGAYGVLQWAGPAHTVTGAARIDNGTWSIADPRLPEAAPVAIENLDATPEEPPVIVSPDGTWHRPLTTLELAVLQGFPATFDGAPLELAGSLTSCRMRIGNAVPPPASKAIASQMLVCLVHADLGRFALSNDAVWVDPAHHTETDITAWPVGH